VRVALLILVISCSGIALRGQTPTSSNIDTGGTIAGDNTYQNPTIGMTMVLPGRWREEPRSTPKPGEQKQTAQPGCPLCGDPGIDVRLQSVSDPAEMVSVSGYELSARYLDRKRYPLKWFASGMISESIQGSGWIPDTDLTSITLGGRPAYRMLVHHNANAGVAFGYVTESHGYMILLVGTALSDPQGMRSAIEAMTLN
jgi:hypothetical protein